MVDGVAVEVDPAIYNCGYPVIAIDHPTATCEQKYDAIPETAVLKSFVFDTCGCEANWNMKNFVADQVELIRRQVGDRKVDACCSGGRE